MLLGSFVMMLLRKSFRPPTITEYRYIELYRRKEFFSNAQKLGARFHRLSEPDYADSSEDVLATFLLGRQICSFFLSFLMCIVIDSISLSTLYTIRNAYIS